MLKRAVIPPIDPLSVWTIPEILPNTHLDVWIAARVWPVWSHWTGSQNRPCVHRLTEGALECPHCKRKRGLKLIGFQPCYDKDGQQLVLVLSHQTTSEADYLMHGSPVRFRRGGGPKTRLRIRKQDDTPSLRALDKKFANFAPVDLVPWLLIYWKDARLKDHVRRASVEEATDPEFLPVNAELVARAMSSRDTLGSDAGPTSGRA